MKIATWNVNSVRARLERVIAFLERHEPDVVCLQETKVVDAGFPSDVLREAGYASAVFGQKTYNGVAILSKLPPDDVLRGFGDGGEESQARLVAARIGGMRVVSVYVPNGAAVGTDPYVFKLEWMGRLREFLEKRCDPDEPLVLTGDFNVAPADLDVHDPEAWRDRILCSVPEREALSRLTDWGLLDAFRELYPEEVAYTWWDYRQLAFPRNRGLRIDHILLTRPLMDRCRAVLIDRDERKGKGASDHAPVIAVLE